MLVHEPSTFIELQGPAEPCNAIRAGTGRGEGGKSTVRGQMRRDQVDDKKEQEPAEKSDEEIFTRQGTYQWGRPMLGGCKVWQIHFTSHLCARVV